MRGSVQRDREALVDLFRATGGDCWRRRDGWASLDTIGGWFGVKTNAKGRVVRLKLPSNNLCGRLPKKLGGLSAVVTVDLSGNYIDGPIPKEFGRLEAVKTLDLSENQLTGEIPKELGDLAGFTTVDLSSNQLAGNIPRELGGLAAMKKLDISSNLLTGGIPTEFGDLSAVKRLDLLSNELTGEIPKSLGGLLALEHLNLTDNHLSGEIPKELGDLPALETLGLGDNRLSGRIPPELGDLPAVTALQFSSNQLREVPLDFLEALSKRNKFGALDVYRNPIARPPQTVMEMGADQAISWWKDIRKFGEGTSNKLKMVLIGLAEAGKTTLVRNITGRPIPETLDRTVGIDITDGWKPVDGGPLEISISDFAGQADYYASHQIFLTKGSLFLLVVDLQSLFAEAPDGVENDGDPHGRVFRWLEMLHLRVPGAAVAVVGTHTDAAEFADAAKLEQAVNRLDRLLARYQRDKAREAVTMESKRPLRTPEPLFVHDKVFRTSVHRDSTTELVEWVGKAAILQDCPAKFDFPAVGATVPKVWIDANLAMESLAKNEHGKRYVTWHEAVRTFEDFMESKSVLLPDADKILIRAMRHREAEGGVILSLEHDPPRAGEVTGMLYLDPTWLIEVIRRLTDHNLVDRTREGTLKIELDEYLEESAPGLTFDMLWAQHR